jgi:hypothetical protein
VGRWVGDQSVGRSIRQSTISQPSVSQSVSQRHHVASCWPSGGHEADHPLPFRAEVKKGGAAHSVPHTSPWRCG